MMEEKKSPPTVEELLERAISSDKTENFIISTKME